MAKRKIVISRLLGGLGNQMFQYAAARSLSLRLNADLAVDTSILRDHSSGRHLTNRDYELDFFSLDVREASYFSRWLYNSHGLPFPVKVASRILRPILGSSILESSDHSFSNILERTTYQRCYLAGLWQSPSYFCNFEQVIRSDFAFKSELPKSVISRFSAIQSPGSVCIHVRRGDYISVSENRSVMAEIGIDYYKSAVQILEKKLPVPATYFVFSDDIAWCRENFSFLSSQPTFVEFPDGAVCHRTEFQLMTLCSNFIIPNSTFSWWAAWLSTKKDKIVISPIRWFAASDVVSTDLIPPEWISL